MTTNKDCLIYMRTSSMTNSKGDSVKRQKSSIMKWVKSNGYTVRGSYWDIVDPINETMCQGLFSLKWRYPMGRKKYSFNVVPDL